MSIFDDIADVVTSAGDGIGKGVAGIGSILSDIPGAGWVGDVVSGPLKDFANTAVGNVVLRALATSLTGGLAPILGPQLASVAFAVPGLVRGEPFDQAWLKEFGWRVEKVAEIYGADAAGVATQQSKQALEYLTRIARERFPNLSVQDAIKQIPVNAEKLARDLGIREDVAAAALALARGEPLPDMNRYDLKTGGSLAGPPRTKLKTIARAVHPQHPSSSAVARIAAHLDVFWVAPDGAIGTHWWDAAAGQGWGDHRLFPITPPGAAAASVSASLAVVSRFPTHLDVFWAGADGAIGTHWWDAAAGQGWADHPPFPITPPGASAADSSVAAVVRMPEHLDVFWVRPDGAIGTHWWHAAAGQGWSDHPPFAITPPEAAALGAGVTAVSRMRDHLDVFWVRPDGAIGTHWWHAAPGQGWGDHPPFPITPPGSAAARSSVTAVARTPSHLDVFWVGSDGAIWSHWWDAAVGQGWGDHAPFPITPPGAAFLGSNVVAASRTAGHLDVFWVAPNGAIWSHWWDAAAGQGWGDHAPFPITPPGAASTSSRLAALARLPTHLDVFWVRPDGAIGTHWWDAAAGQGWGDHQPFSITAPGAAPNSLK